MWLMKKYIKVFNHTTGMEYLKLPRQSGKTSILIQKALTNDRYWIVTASQIQANVIIEKVKSDYKADLTGRVFSIHNLKSKTRGVNPILLFDELEMCLSSYFHAAPGFAVGTPIYSV